MAEYKASSAELRNREQENRKLQLELNTEKEKFNQMVSKAQKDLQDLQVFLNFFKCSPSVSESFYTSICLSPAKLDDKLDHKLKFHYISTYSLTGPCRGVINVW